jgi:hypothetical protein
MIERMARRQLPPADVGLDVQAPRDALPPNHARGGSGAYMGHIGQAHLFARLGVDQQILNFEQVVPDLGDAPNHDVEYLLVFEQGADGDPSHQRRRRPAHVPRFETVITGLFKIDLDFDRRLFLVWLHPRLLDPVYLRKNLSDLLSLATYDLRVWAIKAHGNRLVLAG